METNTKEKSKLVQKVGAIVLSLSFLPASIGCYDRYYPRRPRSPPPRYHPIRPRRHSLNEYPIMKEYLDESNPKLNS